MSERLMLLDSASLYFRAFYGVPDSVKAPDGRPINAVRGLLDMIAKLVATYEPSHLVACWDDDWRPQWRVDLLPTYKAHRVAETAPAGTDIEAVPDPLEAQVPIIRDVLDSLGIPIVGAADHEADDVIGTLSTRSRMPVDIVTGDRDLIQLVDDDRDVRVVYTGRGMSNLEVLTGDAVLAKYAVRPDQYADFATMRGDASDGLPGVAGVGDKTAATLLAAHGDLDHIVAAARRGEGMTAGVRAKITDAADYLDVAPRVVRVVRDLPLPDVDAKIRVTPSRPLDELTARWGLGTSMSRAAEALRARA